MFALLNNRNASFAWWPNLLLIVFILFDTTIEAAHRQGLVIPAPSESNLALPFGHYYSPVVALFMVLLMLIGLSARLANSLNSATSAIIRRAANANPRQPYSPCRKISESPSELTTLPTFLS